ncbi:MAG: phosphate/phosphite/phosphonate ABC transporter substrate-binding protein [Deltaproteobacteria bacterium]|nr:MAG: phosphate/phosphite/phosphonate ABC transporter substrate-binding protein [Deltaproteobacteria bacterium]TMQ08973.1 MAG: phosphate/phosphite/phosphonate ABC transporter substrate-binding protein [Deltaproteobacteria bacterium]
MSELVLGAVAYDAKVVTIWEGFKAYFNAHGLAFDFVLYSNYERQVAAHLRGDIDVAWNSPLAWVDTRRAAPDRAKAIAMRDTDRDLTSVVLVRADGAAASAGRIETVADLRRVAVGALDSPQATLIPLLALAEAGVGRGVEAVCHDVLVGKHGDHIGGERDAVKALLAGTVDAACVIDGNRLAFAREGLFAPGQLRVLLQTGPYDHCNFTVLAETPATDVLRELLLAMSYDDPAVRPLLDMEGLTRWLPGRTSGYALLERAVGETEPGRGVPAPFTRAR